jgi:hypothetical protein
VVKPRIKRRLRFNPLIEDDDEDDDATTATSMPMPRAAPAPEILAHSLGKRPEHRDPGAVKCEE